MINKIIKEQTPLSINRHLPLKKGGLKKREFFHKFGFTLVELLVVISIMGILTVIVASSFTGAQQKSRDAARKANLKSVADALNVYYADNGSYPPELTFGNLLFAGGEFSGGNMIYMKNMMILI